MIASLRAITTRLATRQAGGGAPRVMRSVSPDDALSDRWLVAATTRADLFAELFPGTTTDNQSGV